MYKKNQIPIPRLYRHTRGYSSAVEIGRDVELLRVLWEAGAGEYWLWRRYGVGGRVLGELSSGWDLGKREAVMRKDGDGPVSVGGYGGGLALWVDLLAGVEEPNWGRGFPFGEMARALEAIEGGMPIQMACESAGVEFSRLVEWRRREPRLDGIVRRARALAAAPLVAKVRGSEDWRAAAWLLERSAAREEFRQEQGGGEKLVIEINVARDESIAARAGVIDVTPGGKDGDVVVGLPSK